MGLHRKTQSQTLGSQLRHGPLSIFKKCRPPQKKSTVDTVCVTYAFSIILTPKCIHKNVTPTIPTLNRILNKTLTLTSTSKMFYLLESIGFISNPTRPHPENPTKPKSSMNFLEKPDNGLLYLSTVK